MSTETNNRGARKVRKGVVASKMGAKSVVVTVSYRELHPVYGKVVTRTKRPTRPRSVTRSPSWKRVR